jgi:hypothetical protein
VYHDGDTARIAVTRTSRDGVPIGNPITLVQPESRGAMKPALARGKKGHLVAWQESSWGYAPGNPPPGGQVPAGAPVGIHVATIPYRGLGKSRLVHKFGTFASMPLAAVWSGTDFLVLWNTPDWHFAGTNTLLMRVRSDGTPRTGDSVPITQSNKQLWIIPTRDGPLLTSGNGPGQGMPGQSIFIMGFDKKGRVSRPRHEVDQFHRQGYLQPVLTPLTGRSYFSLVPRFVSPTSGACSIVGRIITIK